MDFQSQRQQNRCPEPGPGERDEGISQPKAHLEMVCSQDIHADPIARRSVRLSATAKRRSQHKATTIIVRPMPQRLPTCRRVHVGRSPARIQSNLSVRGIHLPGLGGLFLPFQTGYFDQGISSSPFLSAKSNWWVMLRAHSGVYVLSSLSERSS